PGKPREKDNSPGKTFSVQQEGRLFAVNVSPLADDVKKELAGASQEGKERIMEGQFNRARDAVIGKGKLLSEQKIFLDDFPGLTCDFQYELEDFTVGRQKLSIANNRLYSVVVSGPEGFVTSPDAEKFITSFKVLEMPGQK